MAILPAPFDERPAVLDVALRRIDLSLLAIPRNPVTFEVTQMRVYRFGADELPSTGGPALRIEFHDTSLHCHPPRSHAGSAPFPAPSAPALERERRRAAPTARIETSAAS